jgi:hypothetical protein
VGGGNSTRVEELQFEKKYKELIAAINNMTTDGAEDMHSRFYPVAIPRSTSQTIREAFQAVLNRVLRF